MPFKYMECALKCRSKKHAYALHSAITKGTLKEIQNYFSLCYNPGKVSDTLGRSALHVAISCGKLDVVEWLLEEMKADLNQKDLESGWTALHRAVFYGQLGAARMLIQYRSDLSTRDHEGLAALDIAMKDRQLLKSVPKPVYSMTDRHDVYTWGDNASFTLGQVTDHRIQTPEVVDEFRKHSIDLRKIVMCKYHTVFLTRDGQVYTCGQGHGGRLGHPTEDICVVPRLVKSLKNEVCIDVAASRDHTLLLTKNGVLYSCGLNDFEQLGQVPAPEKCLAPRQVNCKMLKGKPIKGICTGRFHTVVYTTDAVYTCGLNAGQLGHPRPVKDERQLSTLRQVTALTNRNISIISVVCSDAATVVYTKSGEMFVLHEYQCRKITSSRQDVTLLYAIGGNLDYTDTQNLRENGGRELIISYLNTSGKVFIWRESSPSFKRVNWLIKRQLYIVDYTLTITSIAVVTDCGEVFIGNLSNKAPPVKEPIKGNKESTVGEFGRVTLLELTMQEGIEDVHVRKIPNIHRAMYITADRKGHNYATLQSLHNSCLTDVPVISNSDMHEDFSRLLDEADEYDLIHDVILEVHGQRWPAHKYILVSRCSNFHNLYPKCVLSPGDIDDIPIIKINNVHPQIFEQLMMYIYTDMCDLLSVGAKFILSDNHTPAVVVKDDIFHMELDVTEDTTDYHAISAYQVREQNKKKKGKEGRRKGSQGKSNEDEGRNPLKMLTQLGHRWGIPSLVKRLECLTYLNGYVRCNGETIPRSPVVFHRNKLRDTKLEMYDVSLKSEDGEVFQCHRCILVARLEYFHSMLATGWMETSTAKPLSLPVPKDILEILLDFIYTDECTAVRKTSNIEFLCNILVVADQLLVTRLKEMCEAAIAELITMKNVGELLEFSSTYNAGQLRSTCQQYIVINLQTLLENRYLDMISDEVMEELTSYYRKSIDNMSRRMITPYDEPPDSEYLASLVDVSDLPHISTAYDTKKSKQKKKRVRTKSGTDDRKKGQSGEKGGRRLLERQMSVSSDISVRSDEDLVESSQDTKVEKFQQLEISVTDMEQPAVDSKALNPTSPVELTNSPSCVSFRDILEQEQSGSKKKSPASAHKQGRFSWKDVKKQQKEQMKAATSNVKQEKSETVKSDSKPAGCPWGSMNQTVRSFRSLMLEEQSVKSSPVSKPTDQGSRKAVNSVVSQSSSDTKLSKHTDQGLKKGQNSVVRQTSSDTKLKKEKGSGPRNILSWGLPSSSKVTPASKSDEVRRKAWEDPGQLARSPDNPWNMSMAQSPTDTGYSMSDIIQDEENKHAVLTKALNKPLGLIQSPTDTGYSMSDIIQDEENKHAVLTKALNKPLGLIQIEEQAIQDLLEYYKASSNVDERITVQRVNQVAASPIWKRERLTSS